MHTIYLDKRGTHWSHIVGYYLPDGRFFGLYAYVDSDIAMAWCSYLNGGACPEKGQFGISLFEIFPPIH